MGDEMPSGKTCVLRDELSSKRTCTMEDEMLGG